MNENVLKEILAEVCGEEIAEIGKFPPFKPSLRHRYAMMRIFASFGKRPRQMIGSDPSRASAAQSRFLRPSTRLVIVIAVILCAALLTGFIILTYVSKSFHGPINDDNTQIFAINTESCLTTIEYEYYLPELPEGFKITEHIISSFEIYTKYKNELTGQEITLSQTTKNNLSTHFNTEKKILDEIMINGHNGLCLDSSNNEQFRVLAIWDNDDYILELSGNLPKNILIDLAKSAKVFEN